jgi:hypothetical protein
MWLLAYPLATLAAVTPGFTAPATEARSLAPMAATLMSIFAALAPIQPQAQTAVASNVEPASSIGATAALIWALSDGAGVPSEGGAFILPGSQAVVQYEITCSNGELASVARSYAAVGYGRQVWSIRLQSGTSAHDSASLRSALAPICRSKAAASVAREGR